MEDAVCQQVGKDTKLIETFGYVPGQEVARLALHLARLERSAQALGFECDLESVLARIEALAGTTSLRCRLTLAQDGAVELETFPMPEASGRAWVFRIAEDRLSSEDVLLRHKTTQRTVYDRWRAGLSQGVQEWVFLNERGEVCEGTITNVVVVTSEGDWLTPPLASGCLPGVYRQSLLEQGEVREAVLRPSDLAQARRVFVTNSLRGAMPAVWDDLCPQRARLLL